MARKLTHHLVLEYELKNLPDDWRKRVQDVVRTLATNHELFPKVIEVGQYGTPPKILVSIRREGAESAWSETVQAVMRANITRVLDNARKEEVKRKVGSMGLQNRSANVAGGLLSRYDDTHLTPEERMVRRTKRAMLTVELEAVLKAADLTEPAFDVVTTALERMKSPNLWAIWAGLILKIVEVDVSLSPALKKRTRDLL